MNFLILILLRFHFIPYSSSSTFLKALLYSNSSKFKAKLEIGNNSAAEFDTKFINIDEPLKNLIQLKGFYKISLRVRQY